MSLKKDSSKSSIENSYECPLCSKKIPNENADKHVSFGCRKLLNVNDETQEFYTKRSDSSELYQCPLCFKGILGKDKKRHQSFECKVLFEDYGVYLHDMLSRSEGSLEVPNVTGEDCKTNYNKSRGNGVTRYAVEITDSVTGLWISSGRVCNGETEIPIKGFDPAKKYCIQVKALSYEGKSDLLETELPVQANTLYDLPVQNMAANEEEAENLCKTSKHTDGTNRSPKANINQHISVFEVGSHETSALSTKDITLSKKTDEKSEKIYKATSRFIRNTSKHQKEHVSSSEFLKEFKFRTHESKALSRESDAYCTVLREKKDAEQEKLFEQKPSRCINSAEDVEEYTEILKQQLSDFKFGAYKTRSLSSEDNVHHSALLENNNEEREKVCEQNTSCEFITHETRSSEEKEKKNRLHERCTFNLESGEPGTPGLPDIQDYDTDFVELKWDLPLRDGGASITGYIIEKKDNYNPEWVPVKEVKGNIPKAKVTGFNEGNEYEFRVRAVNEFGPGEPSRSSSPHLAKPKNYVASYSSLKDLFLSGEDCDVMIEVKGKKIGVHQAILKTLTPVLSTIFPHDMRKNSAISETVNISEVDCNPSAFRKFLLFIYSGNVLSDENVTSVYYISSRFDIPRLKEKCVQYMRTALSSNSICDFIYLAARYNEHQLLEEATKFFVKNVEEILVTSKWKHFLQENSILANDLLVETFKTAYIKKQ